MWTNYRECDIGECINVLFTSELLCLGPQCSIRMLMDKQYLEVAKGSISSTSGNSFLLFISNALNSFQNTYGTVIFSGGEFNYNDWYFRGHRLCSAISLHC